MTFPHKAPKLKITFNFMVDTVGNFVAEMHYYPYPPTHTHTHTPPAFTHYPRTRHTDTHPPHRSYYVVLAMYQGGKF